MPTTRTPRPDARRTAPRRPAAVRRARRLLATLAASTVVLAAGVVWLTQDEDAPAVRERCSARVGGESTSMSPEQAGNAATVVGISVLRGLPARAATIAIATVVQESRIENLDHGDRDSLGLFQQRPSQGWGTPAQVQDPVYATNAFYDALVEVEGYRDLPVTDAAQEVQRSGFPLAYGDHEPEARLVASTLTGYDPGGFSCHLRALDESIERGDDDSPTPTAGRLREAVAAQVTTTAPGVVADTEGKVLEYRLEGEEAARLAWAVAGWSVASAKAYDVTEVSVAGSRWTRERSGRGWVAADTGVPTGGVRVRVA